MTNIRTDLTEFINALHDVVKVASEVAVASECRVR
jgi:hypothetical protein